MTTADDAAGGRGAIVGRRRAEPTQAGNPHQLTINQHIHSAACIRRFADDNGLVAVLRQGQAEPFSAHPRNEIFCAKRVWSQQLEQNFRPIEDAFQEECDGILRTRSVANHDAVNEYFSMWQVRVWLEAQPPDDIELVGISPDHHSKETEEVLERKGYSFLRGRTVAGRLTAWVDGRRRHDMNMAQLRGTEWSVLNAVGARRLICPDSPAQFRCIPLDPVTLLIAGYPDQDVGDEAIAQLNESFYHQSGRFVFGHPRDVAVFRGAPATKTA